MRLGYLGLLIVLAGCSSQHIHAPDYSQRVYTNEKPVGLDNTLTWDEDKRNGAAYNQAGYNHVLGPRNVDDLVDHPPETSIPALPAEVIRQSGEALNAGMIAEAVKQVAMKSYSIYETQRWERFCGAGKMDSLDWNFVAKEGRENVPEQLKGNCTPPTFTRQEYLDAWGVCGNTPLTEAQKIIRKTTIAPGGRCNGNG
ncbi:MAG: hypothetical protein G8D89_21565 [gamma proteobacterium symbiont of Clathrolucina costata]